MAGKDKEEDGAKEASSGPTFERSLAELERIVSQLEDGEKPLDESLALYERGIAALKRCHTILDRAEKRISILLQSADGSAELKDVAAFQAEDSEEKKAQDASESKRGKSDSKDSEKEGGVEAVKQCRADSAKISARLPVDSEPPIRQNASASRKAKESSPDDSAGSGGLLFGRAD